MAGAAVVVKGGSLSCIHQGSASLTSVSARLTVAGQGVLLQGGEAGLDCTGCTNMTTTSPSALAPCVSDAATAGAATRLTVGGTAVLLVSATGPTHPKVTPAAVGTWSVASAGQSKLRAV